MAKGLSVHIGLNTYDRAAYRANNQHLRYLPNCHHDAAAKQEIADRFGFKSVLLVNKKATSEVLLGLIEMISANLDPGDMFLLTFSGHGGRVEDRNHDEDDGYDEAWCLYDRMVVDDELFERWKRFRPGVRILVISDSCHSGTCTMDINDASHTGGRFPLEKGDDVMASCLLLAACQDKQVAFGNPRMKHSLYTYWMLEVLKQYDFCESYRELHNRISRHMPAGSKPNLFKFGPGADQFARKRPFNI